MSQDAPLRERPSAGSRPIFLDDPPGRPDFPERFRDAVLGEIRICGVCERSCDPRDFVFKAIPVDGPNVIEGHRACVEQRYERERGPDAAT